MTYQVAKDTADWIIKNAAEVEETGNIGFFGGEPTLEWDSIIVPLTKYIREDCGSDTTLSITSNGLLLTEDKLRFMRDYGIELLLSMDGGKITQDYNRPCKDSSSSFNILVERLPKIIEYFPETTFRSTIIPDTCHLFFENLQFAESMGFKQAFVIINEFEEWPNEKRRTLEQQARDYSKYLISCFREGKMNFIRQRTFEQAINKIISINMNLRARIGSRISIGEEGRVCGTGLGYGSVNYKGDIFSCQEVASRVGEKDIFYLGNIYTGINPDFIQKLQDATNNITIVNNKNPKKCESCPIEATCDVNTCIVNNYIDSQDFRLQSDNICWWNNLMVHEAQYVCKVLGNENNILFWEYMKWILTSPGGCII